MRIATVTLNPAIDQTVMANHFQLNTVNRARSMHFAAGGKGVNVASFLADTGCDVAVTGFLGEENSQIFEQLFTRKHIEDRFIRVPGNTRIGVKIVDEANRHTTDINLPGLPPGEEAIKRLFEEIDTLSSTCEWFVLSGTLPPGTPENIYATIITRLKAYNKKVVLDTSNNALRNGLLAAPTIIKPNIDELQQLVGRTLTEEAEIEKAAHSLLVGGLEMVVVSMGEQGAMFVQQATALTALPPTVKVKSTVGAGDAMVSGLIAGQIQGLNLSDCARLATAYSLTAITREGSTSLEPKTLETFVQQVAIQERSTTPRSVSS